MKVNNIRILDDLENIDIENDNVDVFVETDDGYNYTLSLATPKHIESLIKKEKKNYYGPGYPFIFVNKLTKENIEQAVKALVEENGGYWLKVYHFGGCGGVIDESMFEQLKAKQSEKRKEFVKLDALDLIRESKNMLKNEVNERNLIHLVEHYRSGNINSGLKLRIVPGTCLSELRAKGGARIYFQKKTDRIEVVAISDKDNQTSVINKLKLVYPK